MSTDLKEIQQKAFRYSLQDGIKEIYRGLFLVFYAGFCDYVISDFQTNFLAMPLAFFFAFSAFIIEFVRRRIVYPRTGYAKLVTGKEPLFTVAVLIPLIIFLFLLAIAVNFFGDKWDITPWLKWAPAFFGVVLAVMFHGIVLRSGNLLYYILTGCSVVSGVTLTLLSFQSTKTGIIVYFLIMGGLMFIWGLVTFIRYLRRYPRVPEEETSGNQ